MVGDSLKDQVHGKVFRTIQQYATGDTVHDEGQHSEVEKLEQYLVDNYVGRSQDCLICLADITDSDPIWSCVECATMFHLVCVQRWAKEGIHVKLIQADDTQKFNLADINWACPKCRHVYRQSECPKYYRCFCGAVKNPPTDKWLLPHSCGETCNKKLGCDHRCLLLCHPGRCPPCPKIVSEACFCQKSAKVPRRCGVRGWTCGKPCRRTLSCGFHLCAGKCHEGSCASCNENVSQSCLCGKQQRQSVCSAESWQCESVCDRNLPCRRHVCHTICHAGSCQACVAAGSSCPCGKTPLTDLGILTATCVDDVKCCGDTCDQLLQCAVHHCEDRCHRGACAPCKANVVGRCRCGAKERQVIKCGATLVLCETKCKRKRDCQRHTCNRKCCDGRCPPCEQPCNRTLNCGNHRCTSGCHEGMCYPCPVLVDVTCRCTETVIQVPCGLKRKSQPPKCRRRCGVQPDCHHAAPRSPFHTCHFDRCPPCNLKCEKSLACGHQCQQRCHSAVLTNVNQLVHKPATPMDVPVPKLELVERNCPPCRWPVPVTCIGEHETIEVPCFEKRLYSCGRPCGSMLLCGNHTCPLLCHDVTVSECEQCVEGCTLIRPQGCLHRCPMPCHPAPCKPCKLANRMDCYCGLTQKFIPCIQWQAVASLKNETDRQDKTKLLLSCDSRCPKLIECGHRCTKKCHSVDEKCSVVGACTKKVTVFCDCKRKKMGVACNGPVAERLACDDECLVAQELARETIERENSEKRQKIQSEGQISEQEYERLYGGRKKKRKPRQESAENKSGDNKLVYGILSVLVVVIAIALVIFNNI